MHLQNIFQPLAAPSTEEVVDELASGNEFKLERIVSTGQMTPAGEWYDQDTDEWVLLLSGAAKLLFDDGKEALDLQPGNFVHIPAHQRHRVEWTDPECETVWLALHFRQAV